MKDLIPFKSREVKHCPPHFTQVNVEVQGGLAGLRALAGINDNKPYPHTLIRNWLHETVSNRFFIGQHINSEEGFQIQSFIVAFEDPADATYFSLLLPSFLN